MRCPRWRAHGRLRRADGRRRAGRPRDAISRGLVTRGESVLHVATGNGLKDIRGAMRSVAPPSRIAPSLDAVRKALEAA